jgi:signal transduction histidine kinase
MAILSDKTTPIETEAERAPREAALIMRLKVFGRMRWFAILGIIIATLIASRVFHIGFSTLPVYIICAVIALYNLVLMYQARGLATTATDLVIPRARMLGNIHILFDLVMLATLLHFTGGIENPFIFLFALHLVAASITLHYRMAYLLATSALLMVMLLVGLEYSGVIPHNNLEGFVAPTLYKEGSYILAVLLALAAILYATTYMATSVAGELRKRQQQVVELRERLLQETTGQLEQASADIAKLEEDKSRFLRFLGIAAHDLKAPLTAIQGFLWVMLGGYSGELTDKQKNMLERSSRRINELLNLISDLLDIPRIETGQIVQETKEISLREVIKHSLNDLRNSAKEKGVKLKVELPESLPRIHGSSPRLQQVITNLVSNAINYTPEGTVTIRATEEKNTLRIEVMDTGIGIPAEEIPNLFEDFFRASNVEARGTGLGLSISKRIVEAHGGKIWVESPSPESNQGSKFTFTLPRRREAKRRQQR